MRPHPGAHTHWSITGKYPPPMGATSSRPYPRGHIPKCDPIQGHIPIGILLGRTPPPPPPPSKGATSSQKRGGEGGETKKVYLERNSYSKRCLQHSNGEFVWMGL